ncbi:hypothetical protein [Caballeronia arationis]|uniref:hypothetical protein n=1 Tax=Caballeronia arationis TaxID=1777142 RepID=UPI0011982623|nr:hypothetical protein [Caballeronia arationis]
MTLYFNNDLGDLLRALESDAKFDESAFIFRWLHRAITLPGEPGLCVIISLARDVASSAYWRLCPHAARLFGPRLRPVFMEHLALPRVPGKGATFGFCESLSTPGQELAPDFYLARAAD